LAVKTLSCSFDMTLIGVKLFIRGVSLTQFPVPGARQNLLKASRHIGYMKFEIVKDKKNPAMKRDEHLISIEHKGEATPSRQEIMKGAAKLLKTKEDLIIVDKIISNRGIQSSMVYVLSYRKKDDVPKYKLDKMNARMEKVKAKKEAAKEKAAEAPAPKEEAAGEGTAETGEPAKEEKPAETGENAKEEPKQEEPAEEEKTEEQPAEEKREEAPAETGEEAKKDKKE
jgi:neurofilament heavy polypeptide